MSFEHPSSMTPLSADVPYQSQRPVPRPRPQGQSHVRFSWIVAVVGAVATVLLVEGSPVARMEGTSHAGAVPVRLTRPRCAVQNEVGLGGTIEPMREAGVFARVSGFVRRWLVDMGDSVKENQLLAELDTPELEQQLARAQAELGARQAAIDVARANLSFSRVQARRFDALEAEGLASHQDVDDKHARQAVDEANAHAAEAALASQVVEVSRLQSRRSFARIVAPFAGKISARLVEEGALVATGAHAEPLFRIAVTDPVKVVVQVPEDIAATVTPNMLAEVTVREHPKERFEAKVTRTAGVLDPATRRLRTELQAPNPKGVLLAGMLANVSLRLPAPRRAVWLSRTALLEEPSGTRVFVAGPDDRLRSVVVRVERDVHGERGEVPIVEGLDGTERVVDYPQEGLRAGTLVTPDESLASSTP